MIKQKLKQFCGKIFKAFYPGYGCFVCGREMEHPEDCVCSRCKTKMIKLDGNLCLRCGEPIPEPSRYCDACRTNEDICYNSSLASYEYNESTSAIVASLKYRGNKYIAPFMAKEMLEKLKLFGDFPNVIIPAPISKKRFRKRGFNQTELIAKELNKLIDNKAEILTNVVVREKEVKPQVDLKREDRVKNLQGVFKLASRPSLEGKVALIIDDVRTTGTTINEIARKIKKLKPKAVYALTFAKTLNIDTKNTKELTN